MNANVAAQVRLHHHQRPFFCSIKCTSSLKDSSHIIFYVVVVVVSRALLFFVVVFWTMMMMMDFSKIIISL